MHHAAMDWVRRHANLGATSVLDVGGRDVNGSPESLFADALPYIVLDAIAGPGVDVVADAATWTPDRQFDVVLCLEVFEHTPDWRAILATCHAACRPGGEFIATMAGPGRASHSAIDGGALQGGEHYANVDPHELAAAIEATFGADRYAVDQFGEDVRCHATRGL